MSAQTGFLSLSSRPFVIACATALALLVFCFATGLFYNAGHFSYSLDDPYIHLALAERILQGHYGLNPGEAMAPASSILYPYLLAVFLWLGCGPFGPLIICVLCCLASVWLFLCVLQESGIDCRAMPPYALMLVTGFLMLGLNFLGLASMGLEHSLHIAVTMACVLGVVRFLRSGRPPLWLLACLILEPSLRYEGGGIWLAGIIILWLNRKRWQAISVFVLGLIPVIGFSLFLNSQGLPILPGSVLVHSRLAGAATDAPWMTFLHAAYRNVVTNITNVPGLQLLFIAICLAAPIALSSRLQRKRIWRKFETQVGLFAIVAILGHILFGDCDFSFGNFNSRYAVYALTVGISALIILHRARMAAFFTNARPAQYAFVWISCLLILFDNVYEAGLAAQASHEIYSQQYQMHRFVAEIYHGPVAVNDLGWVSYQNPSYVLDLWGVGSEEARIARISAGAYGDTQWMAELCRRHDVALAMIYPNWYPLVPSSWILAGRLVEDAPTTIAGGNVVLFFATAPEYAERIREGLLQLRPLVPPGNHVDVFAPSS